LLRARGARGDSAAGRETVGGDGRMKEKAKMVAIVLLAIVYAVVIFGIAIANPEMTQTQLLIEYWKVYLLCIVALLVLGYFLRR
jgi:hypothetical protein